uniref:Spermatogenesis associated 22 n=1 Tax=Salarias fasciatus TaxID=181472 RepID=A0A672HQ57_SALFA
MWPDATSVQSWQQKVKASWSFTSFIVLELHILKRMICLSFSSAMGLSSNPVRQQDSNFNFKQNKYPQSAPSKPAPHAGLSQKGQQPYRPPNSVQQYLICSTSFYFFQQGKLPMKPAVENSLRILTAVIEGMRHWSKFKDRVPYLFEIFATLDSAVTLGRYGAKSFLMRDGKDVVQCVFYENWVLPRLIRGQVHRCVGNYDRSRDVLVCVSVRPGLPSELRNALEAVKACDAEMRVLVKSFSEV